MKINRRLFIKGALSVGALNYCAPLLCLPVGTIQMEYDLMEERDKLRRADYILNFASPYQTSQYRTTPHLHQQLKFYIESLSEGKIYVSLFDNGQLGVGTELMAAISHKHIDVALISVSNLSRALPLLDILNIPFWASNNQAYLNLISSKQWHDLVLTPIKKQGKFQILLHHIIGSRTLTTVKRSNKRVIMPEDLKGVNLRVPASKVLNHFYTLTQANIIEVPWSKTAKMARLGLIHALDPSIIGLHSGPDGLKSYLKHVTKIDSVPDAWVTVISQAWLKQLPASLKEVVTIAAEKTFDHHINNFNAIHTECIKGLSKYGTAIYEPSNEVQSEWIRQFGHHQPAWRDIKKDLLGDLKTFDKLLDATNETSRFLLS
ncbi:TRAP transporter substrate-binding protein DctP [Pseudoalteromonas phenolica]|uniref:TRAP transporter substrate-binding protein DctP n=2 Tax=Pseudoalteromonas phenolica TaxID=161398 RepID=A0A4Q7IP34_9GAMM|nr:TRAP transporter substrate-binding protein DctP [Pseudoalteromonas phenolica]